MNPRSAQHDAPARRSAKAGVRELKLTSMLDVCFLLLIFFVLTANFSMGEGILPADLPGDTPITDVTVEIPPQPLAIALHSLGDDQVSIQLAGPNESIASIDELRRVLRDRQLSPSNPGGIYSDADPVVIQPDATVSWSHVVGVYDAAYSAAYENIHFAPAQPRR